jgi:hypothetical protein
MKTEVLVKLAARDPWSFTVLDTLVRKHGIGSLAGVERLKSWRLDFETDAGEDALALTSKILDETALLANPNRDVWMVRSPSGSGLSDEFVGGTPGDGCLFAVRVADMEDLVGRSMAAVLRRRLHLSQIADVAYSLVWILRFETAHRDLVGLAEQIAVARSWRMGLLSNPHSQQAQVWPIEDFIARGVDAE